MSAPITEPSQPQGDAAQTTTAPADNAQPLGESGLKALHAERDARKVLEAEVSNLRKGLAALAGTTTDAKSDPIEALTQRLADMQDRIDKADHARQVADVARDAGITDAKDIELLGMATDEATLQRLVERLTPQAGQIATQGVPRAPQPDPTQGGSGRAHMALNGDPLEASLREAVGLTN